MTTPVTVGLIGTGGHARRVHAPLHSSEGPTQLAGIWGRDPEKAAVLAAEFGVPAYATVDELIERCEAIDFSVPPDVQAEVAVRAAQAGRALLLEKPLGLTLQQAEAVAGAVRAAGVPHIVAMAKRFHPRTSAFLTAAADLRASGRLLGVSARYLHPGFLPGGNASGDTWRTATHGALRDLGPHLLDLVDLAAGPIVGLRAEPADAAYCAITTRHDSGAVGQVAMSGSVRAHTALTDVELYSDAGHRHFTTAGMEHARTWAQVRDEFAAAVRSEAAVTVDVERALHVARLIDAVERSLSDGTRIEITPVE